VLLYYSSYNVRKKTQKHTYLQKSTRALFLNNGLNTIYDSLILVCRALEEEENRNFVNRWI